MASEIGANNYTQVHRQCIYWAIPLFLNSFNTNNLFREYFLKLEIDNKMTC